MDPLLLVATPLLPPTLNVETVRVKRDGQTVGEVFNGNVLCDCDMILHVQKACSHAGVVSQEVSAGQLAHALKSEKGGPRVAPVWLGDWRSLGVIRRSPASLLFHLRLLCPLFPPHPQTHPTT